MSEPSEFAKVVDGVVTQVIVADADHIATRDDGPWILTPTKVGIGWTYADGEFAAPQE